MTFEEFTAAQLPAVLRFAGVLAGDRATAEDIAQEVLIRAHTRWDKIGSLAQPELYVRKMRGSVPVGQDPPSCQAPPGPLPTPAGLPALEGFSVTTGQAISFISTSLPHGITLDSTIWWTNSSGSVLVIEGSTGNDMQVEGVFSAGQFVPIPGTSGGKLYPEPPAPGTLHIDQLAF